MTSSPQTLVLQSCAAAEENGWLAACMESVRNWADSSGFQYHWLDDELFAVLPEALQPGGRITPVIASDLARLEWARILLRERPGQRLLWLDADVLIFAPDRLCMPKTDAAVGREDWVQRDTEGRWRCYRKVHNAALYFHADTMGRNSFLDFYADTARRMLAAHTGGMPPQFIGPKLLTALHNVVQLPVLESVGMISPGLAQDLLGAGNGALQAYRRRATAPLAAANLCRSSARQGVLTDKQMCALVRLLSDDACAIHGAARD